MATLLLGGLIAGGAAMLPPAIVLFKTIIQRLKRSAVTAQVQEGREILTDTQLSDPDEINVDQINREESGLVSFREPDVVPRRLNVIRRGTPVIAPIPVACAADGTPVPENASETESVAEATGDIEGAPTAQVHVDGYRYFGPDMQVKSTFGLKSLPGKRLASRCGREVREDLGYPSLSKANYTIASQRCAQWLKANAKGLRSNIRSMVMARAVFVALHPSRVEVRQAEIFMCRSSEQRRRRAALEREVPLFRWLPANLQLVFGLTTVTQAK